MPLLVDIRKFTLINELVSESARTVSEQLTSVSGVNSQINVAGLSFIDSDDLEQEIGREEQYGATIDLASPPYGTVILTFSNRAATRIAEQMTGQPVESEFTELHESSLQELSNILVGGFVDGWANTFDITIDIGTPMLKQATGDELASRVTSHALPDSMTFIVDATVEIEDRDESLLFNFYMVPDLGSFVRLIDQFETIDSPNETL